MADDKIKIDVAFQVDKGSANQVASAMKDIKGGAKEIQGAINDVTDMGGIAAIFASVVAPVATIAAGIKSASDQAAQFYGKSNASSDAWIEASVNIEKSTSKINLQIQQGMVAPLQLAAGLIGKVADGFAELENNNGGPSGSYLVRAIAKKLGINVDANPSTKSGGGLSNAQMGAYIGYSRGESEASIGHGQQLAAQERSFNRQREVAMQDFQHQVLVSEKQFYQQRAMNAEQFSYSQSKAVADNNYSIMTSNRSYYRDRIKAEADFQRQLRWMNIDHQHNMAMAAMTNDAMAMIQEQYSYDMGKTRAQDDFNYQKQWADQEHAWQLSDQQEAFKRSQAIAVQDYNFNLTIQQQQFDFTKKMAEDEFKYTQQKTKEQFQWQKDQNEIQYNQERDARRRALIYTLTDLQEGLTDDQKLRRQFSQAMLNDLAAAVNQAQHMYPNNQWSGVSGGATVNNHATINIGGGSVSGGGDWMQNIFNTITTAMRSSMP